MSVEAGLRERLAAVRERIRRAAERSGRDPERVRIVAVSKRQPPEKVAAAVRAGIEQLGENYVQEARAKIPRVRALLEPGQDASWHLVGHLQRNKAREALRWFDVIQSLDREELADELERRAAQAGRSLLVFLQVNLSGEPQKAGAPPDRLSALAEHTLTLPHLRLSGLMTLPAAAPEAEASRPAFRRLRELAQALEQRWPDLAPLELSMGMSADFEVAVEEGATVVRIGTAIFGPREA